MDLAWTLLSGCRASLIFFILGTAITLFIRRVIGPVFIRMLKKAPHAFPGLLAETFLIPVCWCIFLSSLLTALSLLPAEWATLHTWLPTIRKWVTVVQILFITRGFFGACRLVPHLLHNADERFSLGTGKALINFITRICQAVVIALSAAIIIGELGYNVSGVVAGLGLGGLSFALGAQELSSNIFGGFILVTERPFEIGDWISTPDVEGTVEDLSLRCTHIRTASDALTVVPNSKLTSSPLTNWTRMHMRLAKFTLGLVYATTPEQVRSVTDAVRAMLLAHDDVHSDTIQVRLLEFGDSSLDVLVQFYTKSADILEFRRVREDVNFRIMEILRAQHVSLAFPSRSLYIENPMPEKPDIGGIPL